MRWNLWPAADIKRQLSHSGDHLYDLALRILMFFICAALVVSVAFMTYRWLAPPKAPQVPVPVVEVGLKPTPAQTPAPVKPPQAEILLAPGTIFKCTLQGRVVFSEKPCEAFTAPTDKAER
ncbi:MAG: hypothetical protein RMK97_10165 [Sutterellaceae bacterium]|nr:hypothetical protein [Burkholderiaceae bacterium]MDW8430846.1 hypothetical protein [Sutterellaceae bacterium]